MLVLSLELDSVAKQSIDDLMNHYKVSSRAAVIKKALAILKVAAHVEKTDGHLVAKKGPHETHIVLR
jgi:hypothetical protein